MQSTAIQMKPHSKQDVKKQSSSADNEKSTNAEMVDPFLQIIMSLITPTQSTQPTDSALVSSGTNQLGELTALLQNSSAGMIALLSTMLKGETGADTGLASNGAAVLASLMNSEAMTDSSGQAAANAALGTQANAIPSAYSEQLSQAMNLSDMLGLAGKNADTTGKVAISSEALAQMTKLLGLSDKEELHTLKQSSPADNEKSTNAEMVDPFLQIIMSLITPTQSTQPTDSALASSGTNQLGELTALLQNSSAGMIALLSTMLKGKTGADTGLASNGAAVLASLMNSEVMTDSSGQAATNAVLGMQANAIPSAHSEQLSQAMNLSDMLSLSGKNAETTGKVAISSEALAQMTKLLGLSDKEELQTLLKNSGIEVISGEEALAKAGISEATVKAKEMLSNYLPQQTEQDDIDVDKLQNEIAKLDSRTPFEFNLKAVSETSDANTLDQITDGIKQNISIGKSEFSIKLTPETLGEITVKLVEEAGKTTLTITTANEQAAKLINKDLDALREAVAPMNVEVRYAVVSTNESAGGSMQQYNMTGQQFAGQQFAGQQSFLQMTQTASGQSENQASDDIYASSQAAQMMALSSNRLDAYI